MARFSIYSSSNQHLHGLAEPQWFEPLRDATESRLDLLERHEEEYRARDEGIAQMASSSLPIGVTPTILSRYEKKLQDYKQAMTQGSVPPQANKKPIIRLWNRKLPNNKATSAGVPKQKDVIPMFTSLQIMRTSTTSSPKKKSSNIRQLNSSATPSAAMMNESSFLSTPSHYQHETPPPISTPQSMSLSISSSVRHQHYNNNNMATPTYGNNNNTSADDNSNMIMSSSMMSHQDDSFNLTTETISTVGRWNRRDNSNAFSFVLDTPTSSTFRNNEEEEEASEIASRSDTPP